MTIIRFLLTGIILSCMFPVYGQYNLKATIRDANDNNPLSGATVFWKEKNIPGQTDSSGNIEIRGISGGIQHFIVSYAGFETRTFVHAFPVNDTAAIVWLLKTKEEEEEEEVVITATRTSRTITNTPTRIEVISGEELAEKGNMKPGDIRMLLSETTGIQTQQTSATSYNAGIRIQGLDGRYTQVLKDGYPMYAGFAGGLSILQIPPLDLKQVEVIKGSSSTLYGGGAIAGLVNLVSKTPGENRELRFIANGTTAAGLDISGFYSERFKRAGLTLYAARNSTRAYDPADIGLTAIPKSERYTINPRLFLYGKKTNADIGVNFITEDRIGGNIDYIKNGGPGYFEKNNSQRIAFTGAVSHRFNNETSLQLKSSYSAFNRKITIPGYTFDARQQSSFSELTWNKNLNKSDWILGANLVTDDLAEQTHVQEPLRDYHYNTYGVFMQNTWTPGSKFTIESGLRGDYVKSHGFELLPRISGMMKISSSLTTRIGGGFGYKTPTVFTEESERIQFRNVLPLDMAGVRNERSIGGNWDVNYRTSWGDLHFTFNHLFYYTTLNRPLILMSLPAGRFEFQNADGHIDTRGMETNVRFIYNNFKLFVGYTYTDANKHFNNRKIFLPLTARHRLNNVLMYEIEDKLKLGFEAYYFSNQQLSDGEVGKSYWILGFMAEKIWNKFSVFINFENFTDSRQSRFDTIYTGSIDAPVFRDIYAPVDGFVMNGGFKIAL